MCVRTLLFCIKTINYAWNDKTAFSLCLILKVFAILFVLLKFKCALYYLVKIPRSVFMYILNEMNFCKDYKEEKTFFPAYHSRLYLLSIKIK